MAALRRGLLLRRALLLLFLGWPSVPGWCCRSCKKCLCENCVLLTNLEHRTRMLLARVTSAASAAGRWQVCSRCLAACEPVRAAFASCVECRRCVVLRARPGRAIATESVPHDLPRAQAVLSCSRGIRCEWRGRARTRFAVHRAYREAARHDEHLELATGNSAAGCGAAHAVYDAPARCCAAELEARAAKSD
eukprot:6215768-Prymnesium_polylepis.1